MTKTEILKQLSKSVELENIANQCYQESRTWCMQHPEWHEVFMHQKFYDDLCNYIRHNNIPIDICDYTHESLNYHTYDREIKYFASKYMSHFVWNVEWS